MAYYTLLTLDNGKWNIQFGSKDLPDVEFEREEYIYGSLKYRRKELKIIKTKTDNQSEIDVELAKLNSSI